MQRVPVVVASLVAAGLLLVAVAIDRGRTSSPSVEVIFGDSNELPETLDAGGNYVAAFDIEWTGPIPMRGGQVSVFMSRSGDTTEDAPDEAWPVVCTSEFDDVVFRQRVSCPFQAPGPGEFALLLEVRNADGKPIGEGLYTHRIIDPSITTAPSPDNA